jgi:hypothetical protein
MIEILYCPFCRSKEIKESDEGGCDYYVVGETFRCLKCLKGFGFLLKDSDDDFSLRIKGKWIKYKNGKRIGKRNER